MEQVATYLIEIKAPIDQADYRDAPETWNSADIVAFVVAAWPTDLTATIRKATQ